MNLISLLIENNVKWISAKITCHFRSSWVFKAMAESFDCSAKSLWSRMVFHAVLKPVVVKKCIQPGLDLDTGWVSCRLIRLIAQEGLGKSTPNLVCRLVLRSLISLLFVDPHGQMSRSLWLKQKKCCLSDNLRRTWRINSKLGVRIGLLGDNWRLGTFVYAKPNFHAFVLGF